MKLQEVFALENSIQIGIWDLDKYSSEIHHLLHSQDIILHSPSFSSSSGDILLFHKEPEDLHCLLSSLYLQQQATVKEFLGDDLVALVEWVNEECHMFRKLDGHLNENGLNRQHLLDNLYRVKPGDTCEYRDPPNSAEEFFEYVSSSKPVVFKSALNSLKWEALQQWSNDYLRSVAGENVVGIKLTPEGIFEGCEDISLWDPLLQFQPPPQILEQLESPDKVVVRPAHVQMKFSEFMDVMLDTNKNTNANYYLEYTSLSAFPQLQHHVHCPHWANFLDLSISNIWIGDGNTLGKLHFDPFDNLLCMTAGKKIVTLFDAHNNENLYEGHIREAFLSYDQQTHSFQRLDLKDSTSMVMSPVDIKNPDLEKYPKFANANSIECTISQSDVLFIPAFWWHEVQSVADENRRNIAVNYWFEPFFDKLFPCPSCRLFLSPHYFHLLPHIHFHESHHNLSFVPVPDLL